MLTMNEQNRVETYERFLKDIKQTVWSYWYVLWSSHGCTKVKHKVKTGNILVFSSSDWEDLATCHLLFAEKTRQQGLFCTVNF